MCLLNQSIRNSAIPRISKVRFGHIDPSRKREVPKSAQVAPTQTTNCDSPGRFRQDDLTQSSLPFPRNPIFLSGIGDSRPNGSAICRPAVRRATAVAVRGTPDGRMQQSVVLLSVSPWPYACRNRARGPVMFAAEEPVGCRVVEPFSPSIQPHPLPGPAGDVARVADERTDGRTRTAARLRMTVLFLHRFSSLMPARQR